MVDYFKPQTLNLKPRLPRRVTLVLGAGGARGLAHVGVLQALEARGIQVERLVGSSMGALVAAVYALDGSTAPAETRLQEALVTAPSRLSLHGRRLELYDTRPYRRLLRHWFGDRRFEDLCIPTIVNAVDLHAGREVQIRRGRVAPALWAASAIPLLYAPVRLGDRLLVDGGLVNPLPLNLAAQAGAGFVIAVDVLPEADVPVPQAHYFAEQGRLLRKFGLLTEVLSKALDVTATRLRDDMLRRYPPDLLITPDLHGFSTTAYREGRAIVARGRAAAERVLSAEC